MKSKKNGAGSKSSLSSLAAGLTAGGRSAPVSSPRNPLVAALARKSGPAAGTPAQRIVAGLMSRTASTDQTLAHTPPGFRARVPAAPLKPAADRSSAPLAVMSRAAERGRGPVAAVKPAARVVTPGSQPHSRPGPTSGVAPGLAGTSRTAASVAPMVKSANDSRAAPKRGSAVTEHRRQYPRADLEVKARLSLVDEPDRHFDAALPTSNLSVGGLFVSSTYFLKLGTRLEVRLSLPPHGREVHVKAEVVRLDAKDEKSSGFALRFTDYLEGSEVVLATHFLSPVLREFIGQYAEGNGFKPTPEYVSHTADVLAAWELRRAALGGDVWVVPGEKA